MVGENVRCHASGHKEKEVMEANKDFFRPKKVSSKADVKVDEMLEVVGVMWSFFVGESPMAMEVVFDKEVDEEVWWC